MPEIVGDVQVTPPLLPVCTFLLFGAAVNGQGSDGGLGLRFSKISVILRKGSRGPAPEVGGRTGGGGRLAGGETAGSHRRSGT